MKIKISRNYIIIGKWAIIKCKFLPDKEYKWHRILGCKYNYCYNRITERKELFFTGGAIHKEKENEFYHSKGFAPLLYSVPKCTPINLTLSEFRN